MQGNSVATSIAGPSPRTTAGLYVVEEIMTRDSKIETERQKILALQSGLSCSGLLQLCHGFL